MRFTVISFLLVALTSSALSAPTAAIAGDLDVPSSKIDFAQLQSIDESLSKRQDDPVPEDPEPPADPAPDAPDAPDDPPADIPDVSEIPGFCELLPSFPGCTSDW